MRPNIRISHALNGRVKDYAAENDMDTSEAYKEIIEAGIDAVEGDAQTAEMERDTKAVRERAREEPVKNSGRGGVAIVEDGLRDRAAAALDELEIKGRKTAVERRRRQSVLWAWDYLREHGNATSSEIANATFGAFWDKDIGYSASSRYPGYQLWDSVVRDALRELPGVDGPGERGNQWSFDEQ